MDRRVGGTLDGMWTGKFGRRGRWAVPGGALLATGAIIGGLQLPLAQAAAPLPAKTPAQLISWVVSDWQRPAERALSGTIVESASLGIPRLPGMQNERSLLSLLAGDHTINVWVAGPDRFRAEYPGRMSETDIYAEGDTAWLWDSAANTATELSGGPGAGRTAYQPPSGSDGAEPQIPTPEQIASDILSAVGPTTVVSTNPDVVVAGRSAYELVLAPKSAQSTIGSVRIDVDGQNAVPLRVQIYARGADSPTFSTGFTSVTFAKPSTADITFTPPPGAHITKPGKPGSGTKTPGTGDVGQTGSGWLTVVKFPASWLNDVTHTPGSTAPVALDGGVGEQSFALHAALAAARPVHGAWGSGKLLHTSLFNVLISDNGSVYAGAVVPDLLYAAAGQ